MARSLRGLLRYLVYPCEWLYTVLLRIISWFPSFGSHNYHSLEPSLWAFNDYFLWYYVYFSSKTSALFPDNWRVLTARQFTFQFSLSVVLTVNMVFVWHDRLTRDDNILAGLRREVGESLSFLAILDAFFHFFQYCSYAIATYTVIRYYFVPVIQMVRELRFGQVSTSLSTSARSWYGSTPQQ